MPLKHLTALAAALLITGCAGLASKSYVQLPPALAISAIAGDFDSQSTDRAMGVLHSIFLNTEALSQTIGAAKAYCEERGGAVSLWADKPGSFNCLSPRAGNAFTLTQGEDVFGAVTLQVIERTPEYDFMYDLVIAGLGYRTDEQIRAAQHQRMDLALEEQRKEKERLIARRISNRDLVAYTGASVCQTIPHLMGSNAVLIGTVEQVIGDKIKVFMARAVIAGAPGLSPGGFKPHAMWLSYLDVEPCA